MTRPDDALLALRPAIAGLPPAQPTPATVADFLHQVLRPVLKLQHEVLRAVVEDFARDYRLPPTGPEAPARLRELLARNVRLRATLTGLVVGHFTTAELAFFRQHRPELTRRLLAMAEQRVLGQ